jgi:aspartate/tyrosine/aromatic aminotransferase
MHGGLIAALILTDPELKQEWLAELKTVGHRILAMRHLLKEELEKVGAPGTWDHVVNQIGMFSYTGLTPQQAAILVNDKHIYLT